MTDHEIKFNEVKTTKDGYTKIRVRFGGNDIVAAVMAKPKLFTKAEIEKYGVDEICRLNLTKWQFKKTALGKTVVSGTAILYYNGYECNWKFYDEPIKVKGISHKLADELYEESAWFEPHNDEAGNYGDESVHAVYTKKLDKILA